MPVPPPPPPPPLPPPPPPLGAPPPPPPSAPPVRKPPGPTASTEASSLRKADPKGRSALLADIQQGTRLRKVTQINDRSAPQIESSKGANKEGGGSANSRGGSTPPALGDLFAGGFPVLRPAGQRDAAGKEESSLALLRPSSPLPVDPPGPPFTCQTLPSAPCHSEKRTLAFTVVSRASAYATLESLLPPFPWHSLPSGGHIQAKAALPEPPQRKSSTGIITPLPHLQAALPPPRPTPQPCPLSLGWQDRQALAPGTASPLHFSPIPPPLPLLHPVGTQGSCPHQDARGASAPPPPRAPSTPLPLYASCTPRSLVPSPPMPGTNNSSEAPPPLPPKSPSFQAQPPKPSVPALPAPPAPPGQPFLQKKRPGRGPGTSGGKLNPPPAPPARSPTTELSSRSQQAPGWTPTPQPGGQLRNGGLHMHIIDDFESKFTFHSVEDFPPPDEYKPCQKIYPSKIPRSRTPGPWLHTEAAGQSSDDIKGRNSQVTRPSGPSE
uniref:WAS/WASL interacting protein family member 3 n=1 Tax=Myotis lucifugus TaxID=59463 RepID=G1Q192_MYOLU